MIDQGQPVIVEEVYHASIDKVWQAITALDKMSLWFFENIPAFTPEVGFKTQFEVVSDQKVFLHLWEILEVVPMKKLVCNWQYGGYPGDSVVSFELFQQQDKTKLKLTHYGIESFPSAIPQFTRESGIAGWEYFIKGRLKEFLETTNSN
ncbi:SRPBCC domain-containing protein [Arenibacter sp. 6A1]|uniref:SRPBCC family protein n=1 Tax=Arenibacter sp. 6A1 TaxID=2720391 RepID=UPI00144874FD|nr:SRPBCC domain-containing protein [Arenibacter sp. 6A1]NKI27324.1 SRPBCC domain-containing protein [Arenibacter sp. 6A1]